MMHKPRNIFLIGLMGVGKTSLGRLLAKQLQMKFYDSDIEIEIRAGVNIPWIFDVEGEVGFRKRELQVIAELTQKENIVLATGGGAVVTPENRELLAKRGLVIYLRASINQLIERTRANRNRPLLAGKDVRTVFYKLLEQREPLYRQIADLVYDTDDMSTPKLLQQILNDLQAKNRS